MKAGILTFHNAINYGAVLQSYALSETLKKLGLESYVIDYKNQKHEVLYNPLEIQKKLVTSLKRNPVKGFIRLIRYLLFYKTNYSIKYNKFSSFVNSKINLYSLSNNSFNNVLDEFDAIISGSDQIWNPSILSSFDPVYFLHLGDNLNFKKISYAASSGSVEILKDKNDFFALLSNFDFISVREKSLHDYIKINTDYDVTTVLDPTLLLEEVDYRKLFTRCDIMPKDLKKYSLIYSLSGNQKLAKIANEISAETDTEVVEISSAYYQKKQFKKHIDTAGPIDFLNLIAGAEIVITDSFHGVCLSIVFRKQFYCALSNNRNSRIIDLLSDLDLSNRIIDIDNIHNRLSQIDYDSVYEKLILLRKKSLDFLINSLNN